MGVECVSHSVYAELDLANGMLRDIMQREALAVFT
jgi:hypothetical protein